jgi:hypothetical protein
MVLRRGVHNVDAPDDDNYDNDYGSQKNVTISSIMQEN